MKRTLIAAIAFMAALAAEARTCPRCNTESDEGIFCGKCGGRFETADRSSGFDTPFRLGIAGRAGLPSKYEHLYGLDISVVSGFSNGAYGIQVAGFANIADRTNTDAWTGGIEIAGLFNWAKKVGGIQVGGVVNAGDGMYGIQVGGLFNLQDEMYGLCVGGIANAGRDFKTMDYAGGIQIGGLANAARKVEALQIAGLWNNDGSAVGILIAGAVNHCRKMEGLQIGGLGNAALDSMTGMQIGTFNINNGTGGMDGMQIGVINVSEEMTGLQIGVINHARRLHGLQIGAINTVYRGGKESPMLLINMDF